MILIGFGILGLAFLFSYNNTIRERRYRYNNRNFYNLYIINSSGQISIISSTELQNMNINEENYSEHIESNTETFFADQNIGKCSITQEEINEGDEVRKLKCNHIFKKEAIDLWLQNHLECPLCRKQFVDLD